MGRFETLNETTKDVVTCLIPALAIDFGLDPDKAVDIIPEDIRMRVWDCERRDHVKDETEDDPRNWGVQFLKDLKAIARMKKGDLASFQADLRVKVALHEEKHPWARLADVKEIKADCENPNRPKPLAQESSEGSSTDSYFEELREPDLPKGVKRRGEMYEAVTQMSSKRKKQARLRRSEDGGFMRKEKGKKRDDGGSGSDSRRSRATSQQSLRRPRRTVESDADDELDATLSGSPFVGRRTPSIAGSSAPLNGARMTSVPGMSTNNSNLPIHVQRLEAELVLAEAELNTARIRHQYLKAMEEAQEKEAGEEVETHGNGSRDSPHPLN